MSDRLPIFLQTAREYCERARAAAEKVREDIDHTLQRAEPPTFQNTILWLEHLDDAFREIGEDFFYLLAVHGTEDFQQAAEEMGQIATALANDISLNEQIFSRVAEVFQNEQEMLTGDDLRLLQKMHQGFLRSGVAVPPEKKDRYREIEERLTQLATQFSQNILQATNACTFVVEDAADISGVPEHILQTAQLRAKKEGVTGWVFGADQPTVVALLTHAPSRTLRQRVAEARARIATEEPWDNRPLVRDIAQLRQEKAMLLGYPHWAAYQLEVRMANSVEQIQETFAPWRDRILKAIDRDLAQITSFAGMERKDMMSWDYPYVTERYQEQRLALNEEEVRTYFPVEKVVPSWFALLGEWYGVVFTRLQEIEVYHPTVEVYDVRRVTGERVGMLYVDLFARPEKRAGAWMSELRSQEYRSTERIHPVVGIAMNVALPTDGTPACLSHDELVTLFHESGHALHGLLSDVAHRSLAGTNVAWDFVELPSQFTENFAYEAEVLQRVSAHVKTGAVVPKEIAQRLANTLQFQAGVQFARQLAFVQLDFAWHTGGDLPEQEELAQFEERVTAPYRPFPPLFGGLTSTSFAHIFAGGYSAGYYSYRWAEMLDADAFEYAKTSGFSPEVFAAFAQEILTKGDSKQAGEAYHAFRGQAPNPEALLTRLGL